MKKQQIRHGIKRYSLFVLLAVTRALHRADYNVPIKYYSLIDSVRTSSGLLHDRISFIDREVEQDFRKKEKAIDRRLGREKFYNENEIDRLKNKQDDLNI